MAYFNEEASRLRKLSDEDLVALAHAALDAHADLNEYEGVSDKTRDRLAEALKAAGLCDCDDYEAYNETVKGVTS